MSLADNLWNLIAALDAENKQLRTVEAELATVKAESERLRKAEGTYQAINVLAYKMARHMCNMNQLDALAWGHEATSLLIQLRGIAPLIYDRFVKDNQDAALKGGEEQG